MIPMTKNGTVKYVPDIFVESYRRDGYTVLGDKAVEAAPSLPAEKKAVTEDDNNIDGAEEQAVEAAPSLPAEKKADDTEPKQSKFICPACGKEYAKKAFLDRHIKEKHS